MGMFSDILAKIFPASHPALAATQSKPAAAATSATSAAPPASASAPAPAAAAASVPSAPQAQPVDVEAVISAMPNASSLNWKTSIVDLLKVLGLDSSLDARKRLAAELGYSGSTEDSATMNLWLHKEVMAKLAANGGKLPAGMAV